jgi:hypothetical protein
VRYIYIYTISAIYMYTGNCNYSSDAGKQLVEKEAEMRDAKTHANPSSLLYRFPHGKVLTDVPYEPVSY